MEYPPISVVIPTLNSSRTLEECLSSLRGQDYDQGAVEVLIVDGGSTDTTPELARKYNCRFIEGGYRDNQEARKGVGLFKSRHNLVLYIDSDNYLPNVDWIKQMVRPFLDHPEVIASQTWRYGIKEGFNPLNRYCALIGANDPLPFYLGKSEKISHFSDEWLRTPILKDEGDYFLVEFTPENLPTVGANGFVVKRDILLTSRSSPDEFYHIDVISDLVADGRNPFAMVRNEIYHDTSSKLSTLALRRMRYFMEHSPSRSARRYFVFDIRQKKDVIGLLRFMIHSATVVPALVFAWQGYRRKRDWVWFLHPIVCLNFLIAYTVASSYLFARAKYGQLKLLLKGWLRRFANTPLSGGK